MNNATKLKLAMKYLEMDEAELARRLSLYGENGDVTTTETVNAWVGGTTAIDAGVMAWIEHTVKLKACRQARSEITFPDGKKQLVVGVANVGDSLATSVLALQMGVAAKNNFHCPVKYEFHATGKHAEKMANYACQAWIAIDELATDLSSFDGIVIKDLTCASQAVKASHVAKESVKANTYFIDNPVDILVMPVDFENDNVALSAGKILSIWAMSGNYPSSLLVHTPEQFTLRFIETCKAYDLDIHAPYFSEHVLQAPRPHMEQVALPNNPFLPWSGSPDVERAELLLSLTMEKAGGSMVSATRVKERIEYESLEEVLEWLQAEGEL